jgi:hypothetical protein
MPQVGPVQPQDRGFYRPSRDRRRLSGMTATLTSDPRSSTQDRGDTRHGWFRELDGASALGFIGPNWFASVMGTGIVAIAAATLPFTVPGITTFATAVWVLALLLLVLVLGATAGHWTLHPDVAKGHLDDPVMAHFYGAPAMGLMTVGAGAPLVGHQLIGMTAALTLDWVLWSAGTLLGLVTALLVPIRAFTTHEVRQDSAFGGWLMPSCRRWSVPRPAPRSFPVCPPARHNRRCCWRATCSSGSR